MQTSPTPLRSPAAEADRLAAAECHMLKADTAALLIQSAVRRNAAMHALASRSGESPYQVSLRETRLDRMLEVIVPNNYSEIMAKHYPEMEDAASGSLHSSASADATAGQVALAIRVTKHAVMQTASAATWRGLKGTYRSAAKVSFAYLDTSTGQIMPWVYQCRQAIGLPKRPTAGMGHSGGVQTRGVRVEHQLSEQSARLLVNAFHAFRSRKKLPAARAELRVSRVTLDEVRRECTEWRDAYTTVRDRYADTVARLQDVEGAYAQLGSEASHTAQRLEATLQHAAAHEQHVREERQRADAAERAVAAQTEAIARQASLDQKALEAERRASTRVHEASRHMAEHLREAQLHATEAEQRAAAAERHARDALSQMQAEHTRELAAMRESMPDAVDAAMREAVLLEAAAMREAVRREATRDAEQRIHDLEMAAHAADAKAEQRIHELEMAVRAADARSEEVERNARE